MPIMRIMDKNRPAPNCWWYATCPWDGHKFQVHWSWDDLLKEVKEYCQKHSYPIGQDFETMVEQWVAHDMPESARPEQPIDLPMRATRLSFDTIARGTKVMLSFVASGMKVVDEAEANRRSEICCNCPLHVGFSGPGCSDCESIEKLLSPIIGNRHTSKAVQACGICGCLLSLACWMPLENQCHGVTEEMKPKFKKMAQYGCWKICD